jgi:phosphoribosylglycinamide formyltransferase-1
VRRFVSEPIEPSGAHFVTPATGMEPPLPATFLWRGRTLEIASIVRTWRSTKTDRGDAYLKRHWFEVVMSDGARAQLYFDRETRRGGDRWWLYTIDDGDKL